MTALVTGASGALGAAFARELAALGFNLILTARRTDRIAALAKDLAERHGSEVQPIALDLCQSGAALTLHRQTEGAGRPVDILVNNAGVATAARLVEIPWETTARQLDLNIRALTELTYRFAQSMRERSLGYILNVSSLVAYAPVPEFAAYSAGKAFVRNFSEALARELRPAGVRVCNLCPGVMNTPFWETAGRPPRALVALTSLHPDRVAQLGLKALFKGRANVVVGFPNKLVAFLVRFLPRRWITSLAAALSRANESP